jgi:hypothetical protein
MNFGDLIEPIRGGTSHQREMELKPGESVRLARMQLEELAQQAPRARGILPQLGIRSPLGLAAALLIGGFVLARVPAVRSVARLGLLWSVRGALASGAREIVRAIASRR